MGFTRPVSFSSGYAAVSRHGLSRTQSQSHPTPSKPDSVHIKFSGNGDISEPRKKSVKHFINFVNNYRKAVDKSGSGSACSDTHILKAYVGAEPLLIMPLSGDNIQNQPTGVSAGKISESLDESMLNDYWDQYKNNNDFRNKIQRTSL